MTDIVTVYTVEHYFDHESNGCVAVHGTLKEAQRTAMLLLQKRYNRYDDTRWVRLSDRHWKYVESETEFVVIAWTVEVPND